MFSKNSFVRTLGLLLSLGLCLSVASATTTFNVTLDSPSRVGAPGTAVDFSGTILNSSGVELFLNGAGGNLSSSELTLDVTPFFTFTPLSLLDGESYSGPLFSVAISDVALGGDYFGTFTIQGGVDSQTFDPVGSVDFQVTIPDAASVPEPSSGMLAGLAGVILVVRRYSASMGRSSIVGLMASTGRTPVAAPRSV